MILLLVHRSPHLRWLFKHPMRVYILQLQYISAYYWSYCLKHHLLRWILLYERRELQWLCVVDGGSSAPLRLSEFAISNNRNI